MTDRVDEVAGKLAKIGIGQVPVLSVVFEVATAFLPPNADARLKAAIEEDLHETVARLQGKVEKLAADLQAQGKKLDNLGAVRTVTLTREVAEALAAAKSPEKQDALLNAAALQFDPTIGAAARAHWFAEVRKLSDMDVVAIRLLAEHHAMAFKETKVQSLSSDKVARRAELQFAEDERLVLESAMKSLVERDFVVHSSGGQGAGSTKAYRLTARGRTLAKYVTGG